ncbi:MAG: hypothetical protein Q9226_001226 [Calogaya cf. arnoldii]
MVYCGPLSKACLPCRRRKLRCDLRRDSCTQCIRAKLTCSGYRDTTALRFRHETDAVQRRATAQKSATTIPASPPLSIRSQARDIFYYNHVVGPTKQFDFLHALYPQTSKDVHLCRSVDAVALAYLNAQRPSGTAEIEARRSYVSAIQYTSYALQSPHLARQDSTILAILLLDLYEKITTRAPAFQGAWAAHLDGALTLVKLRGDEQFREPSILRMLMRLSTNMLISCVASGRPVLVDLINLRRTIAAHFPTPPDPKWQESDLVIEFASLRQDIANGAFFDDYEATLALIKLDSKFTQLGLQVPPAWQYSTILVDTMSNHHYQSYHFIHPAEHVCQMFNTLRSTRILLNELLCSRCVDWRGRLNAGTRFPAIHDHATGAIKQMAMDICASLPQYIDGPSMSFLQTSVQTRSASAVSDVGSSIFLEERPDPRYHLPCYRLIFPLFVAAQSPVVPPSLSEWVVGQLRFMADYHAIKNAMTVANLLESGQKTDAWHVYAMLGSYAFVC